jgi:hypothetical protein
MPDLERARLNAQVRKVFASPDGKPVLAWLWADWPALAAEIEGRIEDAERDQQTRRLIEPERYLRAIGPVDGWPDP